MLAIWLAITGATSLAQETAHYGFEADALDYVWEATRDESPLPQQPSFPDSRLLLLPEESNLSASVGFLATDVDATQTVEVSFELRVTEGTEGLGFLWLDVETFSEEGGAPALKAWEAPNQEHCFGVGFDCSNPATNDPFQGSGNVYDRPQHELSLHFNGIEIAKRQTPQEYRDGAPHSVKIRWEHVVAGAEVSVWIDEEAIFYRRFIAEMFPYYGRMAFGARNTEGRGRIELEDVRNLCAGEIEPPTPPVSVVAIDAQLNDATRHSNVATVPFPEELDHVGRIVCTLRLEETPAGVDPWDRLAHVYIFDENDERFEVLRYITPYARGYEWKVDVTRFRPLLRGTRRLEQRCETYAEGWLVTVQFDFYPGPSEQRVYRIEKLWSGNPEVGNPEQPVSDFYVPRSLPLDAHTASLEVSTVVTGHGMSPNTGNAAEFLPLGRVLTIGSQRHQNQLWKTDCYLNPCRPQGGTWKYDRAGWAPGDVVTPWTVSVSRTILPGDEVTVHYALDDYLNEARGETWAPFHCTEAYAFFYRDVAD